MDTLLSTAKRYFYDPLLRPFLLIGLMAFLGIGLIIGSTLSPRFLDLWAPDQNTALGLLWQVHAAFVSISFAGLSISFQLLAEPPLTAGSARRAVTTYLRYRPLLAFGVGSNVVIGAAAVWFQSDVTVLLAFAFAFLPSVLLIALAFAYSVNLYGHPLVIEDLTLLGLNDLVRKAAREWTDVGRRNDELVRSISQSSVLVPRTRLIRDDPGSAPIRYAGVAGTVARVDLVRLKPPAEQLLSKLSSGDNAANLPELRISLHVRIGERVEPGRILGQIPITPGIAPAEREAFERKVNAVVRLRPMFPPSAAVSLSNELADLQDGILDAINSGRLARAERGYEYCGKIEKMLRREMRLLSQPADGQAQPAATPYPDFVERLFVQINHRAAQAGVEFVTIAVDATFSRCADALKEGDIVDFKSALTSYSQIWFALVQSKDEPPDTYILLSLQNLAEYFVPSATVDTKIRTDACIACTWTFVDMAKNAIDTGQQEAAEQVAVYLGGLYSTREQAALRQEVLVGHVALMAWVLYCRAVRQTLVTFDLTAVVDPAPKDELWATVLGIDARADNPWRMWELQGWRPMTASWLVMSSYIQQASLILMTRNGVARLPPIRTSNHYHLVKQLHQQLASTRQNWPPELPGPERLDSVGRALAEVIDQWEEGQRATLGTAPMDRSRIAAFTDAFETELEPDTGRLIRSFGIIPDVTSGTETEVSHLNVNCLVPKEYFVPTEVLADPADLARMFADTVRRAEDEAVVEKCQRLGRTESCTLADVSTRVSTLTEPMARPLIVVLGYHQVMDALGSRSWAPSHVFGPRDVPIHLLYGEPSDMHLMVVDLSGGPYAARSPLSKDGLTTIGSTAVSAGVFEVVQADADGEPKARVEVGEVVSWTLPHDNTNIKSIRVVDAEW